MSKKKKSSKSKGKNKRKMMKNSPDQLQFLAGLMIGGGAVYLFSDEKLRGQVIRYAMHTYGGIAQNVEELKEQFADIHAEILAEQAVQE